MDLLPKPPSASRISLAQMMQPEHANSFGNVHGGYIMKLVDECAALACMRHAGKRAVTVAMDSMTFREPIKIGDVVLLTAELTYVGRTSMETRVRVEAENPITGVKAHTNNAYLVFVALDENDNPASVPPLLLETDEERRNFERGKQRQLKRLQQSQEDSQP